MVDPIVGFERQVKKRQDGLVVRHVRSLKDHPRGLAFLVALELVAAFPQQLLAGDLV